MQKLKNFHIWHEKPGSCIIPGPNYSTKINSTTTCFLKKPGGTWTENSHSALPWNTYNPYNKPTNIPILKEVKQINPTLFKQAFFSFKPNKASGEDELKPIVLYDLPFCVIVKIKLNFTPCLNFYSNLTPSSTKNSKKYLLRSKPTTGKLTNSAILRP
jgi:hypothetical protein